jgi:hypothetical protein
VPSPFFDLLDRVLRFSGSPPTLERLIQFGKPRPRFCKRDSLLLPELPILQIPVDVRAVVIESV